MHKIIVLLSAVFLAMLLVPAAYADTVTVISGGQYVLNESFVSIMAVPGEAVTNSIMATSTQRPVLSIKVTAACDDNAGRDNSCSWVSFANRSEQKIRVESYGDAEIEYVVRVPEGTEHGGRKFSLLFQDMGTSFIREVPVTLKVGGQGIPILRDIFDFFGGIAGAIMGGIGGALSVVGF